MTTGAQGVTKRYYTPREAAKLLRWSLSYTYARIAVGAILGVRPGGGPVRVPCWWLDQHLEQLERERIEETAIDPATPARGGLSRP